MKRHSPEWASRLGELSLQDGRIGKARWNPGARTLEVVLRVPHGGAWSELLLRYRNVERLEPALPALARLVEDPESELAGHSLVAAAGCWQHRLELRAGPPLVVRFSDLFLAHAPVAGPHSPGEGGHRFEVQSC